MDEQIEIAICVGSSCHLNGSKPVMDAIKAEMEKRGLKDAIALKAAFCLGVCGSEGIWVKVNGKVIAGLTPEKVPAFFDEEIIPLLHD